MKISVEQLGESELFQRFLASLSSIDGLHLDVNRKQVDSGLEYDTDDSAVHIIFSDHSNDTAFAITKNKISQLRGQPVIVVDANYKSTYREIYLSSAVTEYFDFHALDINTLNLTINIAARTHKSTRNAQAEDAKFNLICETLKIGTWNWDLRKNSYEWSARQFELFGIDESRGQLTYEGWRDAIHPEDRERVEAELGRAMVGQSDYHSVFRVQRRNDVSVKGYRWVEGVGRVQRDEHGAALYMYGLNWDVTAKHALADLEAIRNCSSGLSHKSENTFQTYFDQSVDCLFHIVETTDGRLLYTAMNPCGLQHAGLPIDQILGRTPSDVLGKEIGGAIETGMRTAIRTGKPYFYKPTFDMGEGSVIYDAVYMPINNEEGVVVGVLGCARDITSERRMAKSLFNAQKMEALGQMTGGTAHDFNNVLNNISSALDVFEHVKTPGSRASAMNVCRTAVRVGKALTLGMLAFARREEIVIKCSDINQLVVGILEMTRLTIGAQIKINTELDENVWQAMISEQEIEMAIINIATNARDAMPAGGKLTISTRNITAGEAIENLVPGDYVCLTVSDTGTGMAPEVLSKAAEPFYTTKPVGKGTGLGLSMVQSTVANMGGFVQIASEFGHGTTVSIYMMRARPNLDQ